MSNFFFGRAVIHPYPHHHAIKIHKIINWSHSPPTASAKRSEISQRAGFTQMRKKNWRQRKGIASARCKQYFEESTRKLLWSVNITTYGTCGSPWSLPAALLKWTICALVWQLSPGSNYNWPDQCAIRIIRKRISMLESCHSPTLFTCYQGATWQHHCNGGEWCGSKYRQPPRGPSPTWNPMYRAPMSHALSTMAMAPSILSNSNTTIPQCNNNIMQTKKLHSRVMYKLI